MSPPSEEQVPSRVTELFREWFADPGVDIRQRVNVGSYPIDFVVDACGRSFAVAYKRSSDAASVAMALEQIQAAARRDEKLIPLLLVPYMGTVGARRCQNEGVGWIDLSGNAHVEIDSFYLHVEGKPNRYKRPGRPSNAFAPKSSRIARFLLMHPGEYFRQADIADATDVGRGYTSKIVRRLEEKRLITVADGKVGTERPNLLLDAWRERYEFSDHNIVKGTVAARESQELTKRLAHTFEDAGHAYAVTGLSAAWILTSFARYRITTVYLDEEPDDELKREIGFREDPQGANLWLTIPNDEGVFHGAAHRETAEQESIRCVHPVQVYLDLLGHPERSSEAAEEVRRQYLTWARS